MPAKLNAHAGSFDGVVVSGLAKARSFLSKEFYVEAIRRVFGFEPFPGTLNLRVDLAEAERALAGAECVEIRGDAKHGGLKCWRAALQGTEPCVIVFPEKSAHENTVELVSKGFLRKKLNLGDGSKVMVRVE